MPDRPAPFLFDLDGTLADTIGDIAASANHVRAHYDLPPHPVAAVRAFVGHGAGVLLRRALAELGWADDDDRWAEAYAGYARHHEQACVGSARLYPGVVEHLTRLQADGHPMAVVTNKPGRFAEQVVAHLGLDRFCGVVVGGDALPRNKPHPDQVLLALERLDAAGPPRRGTMVGDGETDLRAGKAAGLRTIGCLFGYRPAAALRAEGADEFWVQFGVPD